MQAFGRSSGFLSTSESRNNVPFAPLTHRKAGFLLEQSLEEGFGRIAAKIGDGRDGLVGLAQQGKGLVETQYLDFIADGMALHRSKAHFKKRSRAIQFPQKRFRMKVGIESVGCNKLQRTVDERIFSCEPTSRVAANDFEWAVVFRDGLGLGVGNRRVKQLCGKVLAEVQS